MTESKGEETETENYLGEGTVPVDDETTITESNVADGKVQRDEQKSTEPGSFGTMSLGGVISREPVPDDSSR